MPAAPALQPASSLGYMPQLDALRGVSVLVIMLVHFAPAHISHGNHAGLLAVGLFFTLSGYLITGILLRSRRRIDAGDWSFGPAFRHYFIRRALRVFPPYYAVILLTLITNSGEMRQSALWHSAYLSNVYFTYINTKITSSIHLWTLSVEEQFYIVWPLVVLLAPRRLLLPIMLAVALAGIVYRQFASDLEVFYMTFAQMDYLALGGVVALIDLRALAGGPVSRARRTLPWALFAIAAALILLGHYGTHLGIHWRTCWTSLRTGYCFVVLALVAGGAIGFRGPIGRPFTFRPLIYLGTISYGVYLIHNYLASWVRKVPEVLGIHSRDEWNPVLFCLVAVAACIAFGAASFRLFEAPILSLKDRLAPVKPAPVPPAPARSAAGPETSASTLGPCPPGSVHSS